MEYETSHKGYFDRKSRPLQLLKRKKKKCDTCFNEYEATKNQRYCRNECKAYIYVKQGDR